MTLIIDEKTGLKRESRKFIPLKRVVTETEINEILERIKFRREISKEYADVAGQIDARIFNPEYVPNYTPEIKDNMYFKEVMIG